MIGRIMPLMCEAVQSREVTCDPRSGILIYGLAHPGPPYCRSDALFRLVYPVYPVLCSVIHTTFSRFTNLGTNKRYLPYQTSQTATQSTSTLAAACCRHSATTAKTTPDGRSAGAGEGRSCPMPQLASHSPQRRVVTNSGARMYLPRRRGGEQCSSLKLGCRGMSVLQPASAVPRDRSSLLAPLFRPSAHRQRAAAATATKNGSQPRGYMCAGAR